MEFFKDAVLSECGKYRYSLFRSWGYGPRLLFIMLNPSTADHTIDDPTVRKCIKYAKKFGFDSLSIVNLFAYRATDPKELKGLSTSEKEGDDNYMTLSRNLKECMLTGGKVVVAWGNHGGPNGTENFFNIFRDTDLYCLDQNKNGAPKHPLYCKDDLELKPWHFKWE